MSTQELAELDAKVADQSRFLNAIFEEMGKIMVGQRYLVERLLLGLIADGHVLVEGVPGLAKTTAVKTLAQCISTGFARIQFTPDLLPADVIGTQIYRPQTGEFTVKKGPIFSNLVLADEINRAPAKVQSALLEAMQERQVTIGENTFALPRPFLVMATQNPIEQEGTYPLPEAQVDRFMLKLRVDYPSKDEELRIVQRMGAQELSAVTAVATPEQLLAARAVADQIKIHEKLQRYIVDVVYATRQPKLYGLDKLAPLIQYGASPRASIYLNKAAKASALMAGRSYVTPQDIKSVGLDILRHRVILSYEAEAQNLNTDDVIAQVFDRIDVP